MNDDWDTPTLRNMRKMLFRDIPLDRSRFWGDTAYYNFVQRLMPGPKHRPSWDDFYAGWPIFFRVLEVLQPSFCLFIGIEATKSFWHGLEQAGREPFAPELRTKVSRTRGRHAELEIQGRRVEIAFVQHTGRYFSWEGWHDYLQTQHPILMAWLSDEDYSSA